MLRNTRHSNEFYKTDENAEGTSAGFDAVWSEVSCQVEGNKSCNPIHHSVHAASVTGSDTDLKLIDITGQIGVSAPPGLTMFTLELNRH